MGVDVLVLAAHVHAADTRVSRDSESQDGWTRVLRLVVPVSDPDRWSATSAARRIRHGRQYPQCCVLRPCQRPLVGAAQDREEGVRRLNRALFAQAATISPLVLSQ
jgi:hypothetical protein